jgi:chromosome segregation ATPase
MGEKKKSTGSFFQGEITKPVKISIVCPNKDCDETFNTLLSSQDVCCPKCKKFFKVHNNEGVAYVGVLTERVCHNCHEKVMADKDAMEFTCHCGEQTKVNGAPDEALNSKKCPLCDKFVSWNPRTEKEPQTCSFCQKDLKALSVKKDDDTSKAEEQKTSADPANLYQIQIDELNGKVADLIEANKKLADNNKRLADEAGLPEMKAKLDEQEKTLEDLRIKITTLGEEKFGLEKEIKVLKETPAEDFTAKLEDLEAEKQTLGRKIFELDEKMSEMVTKNEENEKTIKHLEELSGEKAATIKELNEKLKTMTDHDLSAELEKANGQIASFNDTVKEKEKKIGDQTAKIKALEKCITEDYIAKSLYQELEASAKEQINAVSLLKQELEILKTGSTGDQIIENMKLAQANESLKAEKNAFEKSANDLCVERDRLLAEKTTYETSLAEAISKSVNVDEQAKQEIKELTEQKKKSHEYNEALKNECDELKKEIRDKAEARTKEISEQKSEKEKLLETIEALKSHLEESAHAVEQSIQTITERDAEIKVKSDDLEKQRVDLTRQIDELSAKLGTAKQLLQEAEDRRKNVVVELDTVAANNRTLTEENATLQTSVKQAESAKQAAEDSLVKEKEKFSEKDKEVHIIQMSLNSFKEEKTKLLDNLAEVKQQVVVLSSEKDSWQLAKSEFDRLLKTAHEETTKVSEKVAEADKRITALQDQKAELEKMNLKLEYKWQLMADDLEKVATNRETVKNALSAAEVKIGKFTEEFEEKKDALNKAKAELKVLSDRKAALDEREKELDQLCLAIGAKINEGIKAFLDVSKGQNAEAVRLGLDAALTGTKEFREQMFSDEAFAKVVEVITSTITQALAASESDDRIGTVIAETAGDQPPANVSPAMVKDFVSRIMNMVSGYIGHENFKQAIVKGFGK